MSIRPLGPPDVDAVAGLERLLFGVDAWSPVSVGEELAAGNRAGFAATLDGDLVGYVVTMHTGDVADLQRIGVHPDHRRHGLATALLAAAQEAAVAAGANRMLLEVADGNVAALAFYAREGFVEIDRRRRYYRDGSDAVVLRRQLGRTGCGGRE